MSVRILIGLLVGSMLFPATTTNASQMPVAEDLIPVNLDTLGGTQSQAKGISNAGHIVGQARDAGGANRPFIWFEGMMTDLGTPTGAAGAGMAVNAAGLAVGWTNANGSPSHAFRNGGSGAELDDFEGLFTTIATGVNSSGQVVGYHGPFAFLWEGDNVVTLPSLPGGGAVQAMGISDGGAIVGRAVDAGGQWRAFLYESDEMTDLGTLGGTQSVANAVSEAGHVVGQSLNESGLWRAFLATGAGDMTDLGTLGGAFSAAYDVNQYGFAVGASRNEADALRAFLFYDGVMIDLNDLLDPGSGWVLVEATGINDQGQIAGWGWFENQKRAFVLLDAEAIPEPATVALIALGALAALKRRRH